MEMDQNLDQENTEGAVLPDGVENVPESTESSAGLVGQIQAGQVEFGPGLAGQVQAQQVSLQQAGALAITAGQDAEVAFGGALAVVAGRDMKIANGGALVNVAGRDVELSDGMSGIAVIGGQLQASDSLSLATMSGQAHLERSVVGILLSRHTELGEGNRVLLSLPQAAAFGAALGAVLALLGWVLRKK